MSDILTSITSYAVAKKADGKAFNQLRGVADTIQGIGSIPVAAAQAFKDQCRASEVEFMEKYHANDQKAKTKGKMGWKFRTYLPNAYSTSKCVLTKALEGGIVIGDKGKNAIEKETKAAAPTKAEKDPVDVFKIQLDNLRKAIESIKDNETRLDAIVEARAVVYALR